jgi:hypothetical protein
MISNASVRAAAAANIRCEFLLSTPVTRGPLAPDYVPFERRRARARREHGKGDDGKHDYLAHPLSLLVATYRAESKESPTRLRHHLALVSAKTSPGEDGLVVALGFDSPLLSHEHRNLSREDRLAFFRGPPLDVSLDGHVGYSFWTFEFPHSSTVVISRRNERRELPGEDRAPLLGGLLLAKDCLETAARRSPP